MKLHSLNLRYSSWSVRAWLAAHHSGLPIEIILHPLFTPQTDAWLAAHAPARKLPMLVEGDVTVWDSQAVIETLAERAPLLWPQDSAARATARSACAEMHAGFQPLRQQCPMNTVRHYPGFALDEEARANVTRIEALWQDCRRRFGAGGDFLFGRFTAADCVYAPVVSRFITYDVALQPETRAYVTAMQAHPLIRRWYAEAAAEPWIIDKYEY